MKTFFTLLALVTIVVQTQSSQSTRPYYDLTKAPAYFDEFVQKYNKKYNNSVDFSHAYLNFVENLKTINSRNMEAEEYGDEVFFGITEFADLQFEEYVQCCTGLGSSLGFVLVRPGEHLKMEDNIVPY
ncbi:hypothetical protein O0L34_g4804 [Tuta absoluta]|nr:hypothetical protein O0L34_g4804 [Tuta absoluta]